MTIGRIALWNMYILIFLLCLNKSKAQLISTGKATPLSQDIPAYRPSDARKVRQFSLSCENLPDGTRASFLKS